MNELIKIQDYNGKKAVSARELHEFLESKKDFSSWIKHRIGKYGLIENVDYVTLPQMGEPDNHAFTNPNPPSSVSSLDNGGEIIKKGIIIGTNSRVEAVSRYKRADSIFRSLRKMNKM